MFRGCSNLIKLDLTNFNTNNITNMDYMFHGCFLLNKNNTIVSDRQILKLLN